MKKEERKEQKVMFEVDVLVNWKMHEKWPAVIFFLMSAMVFHVRGISINSS